MISSHRNKMLNLKCLLLVGLLVAGISSSSPDTRYEDTWESLDSRPFPPWYDEGKIGIFIHWGVFSVPSFGSEWFWSHWKSNNTAYVQFMEKNYPPGFSYQDFGREFTAEFYDAKQWADLFEEAGARYIVLTSKHHEGYTLWPSKNSFSWNSLDVGSHRDLVGELANAIRSRPNIKFGLYHSLFEWFNPLYIQDKQNNFTTNDFVMTKTLPELYDLVETYKPEIVWSDGDWEPTDDYWKAREFIAWLYNDSPVKETVLTNDRWGSGIPCKHGGYFTCTDRYSPGVLQPRKWENCMTIDKGSWGFRRNAKFEDYLTNKEILTELVKTVSCGGNLLINVGPTKEGIIMPIFAERLKQMGNWLKLNGEAIYGSQPWTYQNDTLTPGIWFTKNSNNVYASVLDWPQTGTLEIESIQLDTNATIHLIGYEKSDLKWTNSDKKTILIQLPEDVWTRENNVWVFKFSNVLN